MRIVHILFSGFRPNIIQIAACREDQTFTRYILPPNGIPKKVVEVTGLSVQGTNMFYRGSKVKTVSLEAALTDFITFLQPQTNLVGHNINAFDNRILLLHLKDLHLISALKEKVASFMDTLPMVKELYPERKEQKKNYKQEDLVCDILGTPYNAHNALADVTSLQNLCTHINFRDITIQKHAVTFSSTVNNVEHKVKTRKLKTSLHSMVCNKVLSDQMATKIASTGLSLDHLKLAYKRGGVEGLKDLFCERTSAGVRITKNQRIIQNVSKYIESL